MLQGAARDAGIREARKKMLQSTGASSIALTTGNRISVRFGPERYSAKCETRLERRKGNNKELGPRQFHLAYH